MAEEVTFNGAGCSVKILSQNIKIPMLIQNSNVVINNPATTGMHFIHEYISHSSPKLLAMSAKGLFFFTKKFCLCKQSISFSGSALESIEREPSPPPPDLLTKSEEQIDRSEERLLNKNLISSLEKWEKLGKHLGLTEGQLSDVSSFGSILQ